MEYLRQGTLEAQQQALGATVVCCCHSHLQLHPHLNSIFAGPIAITLAQQAHQPCSWDNSNCTQQGMVQRQIQRSRLSSVIMCWHAECIRHDYASLAENAYPEAYSEFKHSMLLLVFEEELQTSPVKADWSLQTRTELAGMLCRTLRQIAGRSCCTAESHVAH